MSLLSGATLEKWFYETKIIRIVKVENDVETLLENIPKIRLTKFDIVEDFERNYFPLFSIELTLETSVYKKIVENKDNVRIYLRIDKFARHGEGQIKLLNRKFIDGRFILIMDETFVDYEAQLKQTENSTDYKSKTKNDKNQLEKVSNKVRFYLFPETIDGTKKNVDKVFTDCTVMDVYTWLFYNTKTKNVLMCQPDNLNVYNELIIPPLSTLKAFSFIDTYYGLYKYGSIMFFGIWYNYVIPFDGKNHVMPADDKLCKPECHIVIPRSDSDTKTGMIKYTFSGNLDYVLARYDGIEFINASVSNDYLHANNIESVDSFFDIMNAVKSDATHRKKENFIRFFDNHTENPYLPYNYVAQTNALSDVARISFIDDDASVFLPFKRFNVIFEDSNYTKQYIGNYALSAIIHHFTSSGSEFSVVSEATLKKITIKL